MDFLHGLLWGPLGLSLLLGVGVLLTLRLGLVQLRLLPRALGYLFRRKRTREGVSPFRALCTALAATVGTGNIAGVAGAIAIGGPGAVFWIWISGFLGMAVKFSEAVLAVHYCHRDASGERVGGPMYILRKGLGERFKPLAAAYALFGVLAAFGVGNAAQVNAVALTLESAARSRGSVWGMEAHLLVGLCMGLAAAAALRRGARGIGEAAQVLVPVAAVGYLLLCAGVIVLRRDSLGGVLGSIFRGAFSPAGVTGGMVGSAFTCLGVGISRGVFTNEAGMGTAAIAHAAARVEHPVEQGLMGILEVFVDTIVICTLTALAILTSGCPIPYGCDPGAALTSRALESVLGSWASWALAAEVCLFAFATVLGWSLYGGRCAQYLWGERGWRWFLLCQCAVSLLCPLLGTGSIWRISEVFNALMMLPNLPALVLLASGTRALTRDYLQKETAPKRRFQSLMGFRSDPPA